MTTSTTRLAPATSPISYDEGERVAALLGRISLIFDQRIVGQQALRTALISSLLADGHVLLESVPGLAKTTAAQTSTQLGPVHANMVLLDEINRSSAKTQSAMLEAMQERQTSIGGTEYPLPKPFMVLATQNPIEEEGTYVLPEAQMDRFLMKEVITYPSPDDEVNVLDRIYTGSLEGELTTEPISIEDVLFLQQMVRRVYVDDVMKQYIVALINTTRGGGPRPLPNFNAHVRVGSSPRGGIALMRVAQALALQAGRAYIIPDDVKALRHAILRHRLVLTYDALANNVAPEALVDAVFAAVPTP